MPVISLTTENEVNDMKKTTFNLILTSIAALILYACSGDSLREVENLSLNATSTTAAAAEDIAPADLIGSWVMYSMTSIGTTVDFDQNGVRTNDLLAETDCFDPMYFVFKETGEVDTRQSRLYFNAQTGAFTCLTTGDYTGTYAVSGNILTVNFTVNGSEYSENKTISRYNENGSEFLLVTLTKGETDAAVYIADDPGNTVASEIQKIEIVYKKQ